LMLHCPLKRAILDDSDKLSEGCKVFLVCTRFKVTLRLARQKSLDHSWMVLDLRSLVFCRRGL
jgi:hypothetical protein